MWIVWIGGRMIWGIAQWAQQRWLRCSVTIRKLPHSEIYQSGFSQSLPNYVRETVFSVLEPNKSQNCRPETFQQFTYSISDFVGVISVVSTDRTLASYPDQFLNRVRFLTKICFLIPKCLAWKSDCSSRICKCGSSVMAVRKNYTEIHLQLSTATYAMILP